MPLGRSRSFHDRSPPECPWCGGEMESRPEGKTGRLYCPNDDPIEFRIRGGRWYIEGRQLGLDEPFPETPESDAGSGGAQKTSGILDEAGSIIEDAWARDEDGDDNQSDDDSEE